MCVCACVHRPVQSAASKGCTTTERSSTLRNLKTSEEKKEWKHAREKHGMVEMECLGEVGGSQEPPFPSPLLYTTQRALNKATCPQGLQCRVRERERVCVWMCPRVVEYGESGRGERTEPQRQALQTGEKTPKKHTKRLLFANTTLHIAKGEGKRTRQRCCG